MSGDRSSPSSGAGYTRVDPDTDPPANHICAANGTTLTMAPRTLAYNTYYGKHMLVGMRGGDIVFSLSTDLINWGPEQVIVDGPESSSAGCPVNYPSILDDNDPAATPGASERNFYRPDRTAYVYFTRTSGTGASGCSVVGRDLGRIKVTLPAS